VSTYEGLPPDLPVPLDDGATDHLPGERLPDTSLPSTSDQELNPSTLPGRNVLYVYPMTGRPGIALPDRWDAIPGARGCTPEACGFRDHLGGLREAGVDRVLGISSQSTDEQREARVRLHLPYELLSDADFAWAEALALPTFTTQGRRFHARLTLIVRDGMIEHVFYPVFPPDAHAVEVLAWVRSTT
jgi:peroxiredoxin